MGSLSRNKGKRGELEAAELLRRHGFTARRGRQFQGGDGSPDVVHDIPGVHVEVKRAENLSLYGALAQAIADAGEGRMPLILHRRNSKPWVAVMLADDLLGILGRTHASPKGK